MMQLLFAIFCNLKDEKDLASTNVTKDYS